MSKQTLYIIAGANGSGKTTFVNKIFTDKIIHINADEIAKNINPNDIDKAKIEAGKITINKINNLLKNNKSFSIETTLSGNFLINIISKAKELSYKIVLYYIFLDNYNICINRVKSRFFNGGHNVPISDIIRRYKRSKNNFIKYKNLVNEYKIYYNGNENIILVNDNGNIINWNLYNIFIKDLENEK